MKLTNTLALAALLGGLSLLPSFQKPPQKPAAPETAGPITPQMLAPLEGIARQLAKGGREKEMKDLLFALDRLGLAKANHEKLSKACLDDLAKAKKPLDHLDSGAKQIRVVAKQLAAVMATLSGEEQLALARRILMLDGENAEAHALLGHVQVAGEWAPAAHEPLRERRGDIYAQVREAKKLAIDGLETGMVEDAVIRKACGVEATFVRRGQIELRANFKLEKAERMLRETLRALALSRWLRTGKLDLPRVQAGLQKPWVWVLIDSREKYKAFAAEMIKSGEMIDDDVKILERPNTELGGFTLKNGVHVHLAQFETAVQAPLLVALAGMRENVHTPLTAGHLNWVTLSCFGCTLPNFYFKESEGAGFGDTRVQSDEEKREREELLRLAKAGIAGSRTWMRYLAERGEDPAFARSFVDALGAVQGNDLHKCTSIVEFLDESNLFQPAYKFLSSNPKGRTLDLYASALGFTVGELEARWREWLLGSLPGVAERIAKKNEDAWPPEALDVLAYMNQLREQAFAKRIEGLWKLRFDPDLSVPCALHAAYLVLHPEQKQWPDAHEEYADKEGYTVEGAWAGGHSVIVWGSVADYKEAVDVWMGSFYHRLPLIDPGLLRIGWGWKGEFCVMDTDSLAAPYDKEFVVVWPYAGQQDVPTAFIGNEYPDPIPSGPPGSVDEAGNLGYPVTLQTNPLDRQGDAVVITMTLYTGKDFKEVVDCHFSTPQEPTNPELAPAGAWCLLPKAPLKLKTEYKVVADWKVGRKPGGETSAGQHLEWTFKTN